MDRGAWRATVHEVAESDRPEHARIHSADHGAEGRGREERSGRQQEDRFQRFLSMA